MVRVLSPYLLQKIWSDTNWGSLLLHELSEAILVIGSNPGYKNLLDVPTVVNRIKVIIRMSVSNNQDIIETTAQETQTQPAVAKLCKVPTSPRKMRLVVDNVRGLEVERAMATLRFSPRRAAAQRVEQLIRSAISNWEQQNGRKADEGELYVSKIYVDEGATLKRLRPAPQGRGYRIRKRANHITVWVDKIINNVAK